MSSSSSTPQLLISRPQILRTCGNWKEEEEVTSADIRKELFEGNNIERGGAVKDAMERGILDKDKEKDQDEEEEDEPMGTNIKITEKKKD